MLPSKTSVNQKTVKKVSSIMAAVASLFAFHSGAPANADVHLAVSQLPLKVVKSPDNGQIAPNSRISFDILLPVRNQPQLQQLISRIYDPSDSLYKKFLTPTQFKLQFGPTDSDVATVEQFASSKGLTVEYVARNNTYVRVSGSAEVVEAALRIEIHNHTDSTGRTFYALDREPSVPTSIAAIISGFAGLDNAGKGHPDFIREGQTPSQIITTAGVKPAKNTPLINFTGVAGLSPSDVKKLYSITSTQYTGAGLTVAVFEDGTFYTSDPQSYEQHYNLPTPIYTPVSVDGFETDPTIYPPNPEGAEVEVNLDLDMFAALAPSVKQVKVYENDDSGLTPFPTEVIDSLNLIANDPTGLASVISISYGESEQDDTTFPEAQAENAQLEQIAAQGQSVFVSSGDSGAYDEDGTLTADDPGIQPLVTSVGGTDLFDTTSEQYELETAWGDYYDGLGGGGGISAYWPLPSYQQGAFTNTSNPQGSATNRNGPDVSLFSDPSNQGYDVYEADLAPLDAGDTPWIWVAGTSAASPLWAAFFADADQALASSSQPPVGFANPLIYRIAESSKYSADFNDVTIGSNLFYNCGPGYDNSTGWGSFKGTSLFNDIVSQPSITGLSPSVVGVGSAPVKVVINGDNLSTATAASWNGIALTGFKAGATSVSGTIAASGLMSPAAAPIVVTTSTGPIASPIPFTVTGAPVITSFTPTTAGFGALVTVFGSGLSGITSATLDGAAITPSDATPTSFSFRVPNGAKSGVIGVTTTSGSCVSSMPLTVVAPPTITSFSPTYAYSNTTSDAIVDIKGTSLSSTEYAAWDGYVGFEVTVISDTEVTVDLPAFYIEILSPASSPITLFTEGGSASTPSPFLASNPPQITSFTPTSGPVGTSLTITGTDLEGVTSVVFAGGASGISATPSSVSPMSITVAVPVGASTGVIEVVSSGGNSTSSGVFTVVQPPTITSFTPSSGPIGTSVVLTGTYLTGAFRAAIGDLIMTPTNVTATSATVVIPNGASTNLIKIRTPNGVAYTPTNFTVAAPAPTISSFSPTSGPAGTTVVLTGTNLTGTFRAAIGDLIMTPTNVTATSATVVIPDGASTNLIKIRTPNGVAYTPTDFTLTE